MVLVPGVPALLPEYASLEDPVADLRAACRTAVERLGPRVRVVASAPSGGRVGAALVEASAGQVVDDGETGVLLVGNGSAKRTEKAPGHLDERAEAFDAALAAGLRGGTVAVDAALADELWADVGALAAVDGLGAGEMLYDATPFGVAYWVVGWR
ncbi:class III extradiol ring-cleavage dioxygenase family protein [Nocardioides sambongensis]|uniref:hypothetical protein n=1 Tax=Nocardioides sambongensis TaxID=2589074 RepID=UPI001E353367|nr:hypothetical protein [Nocardioides sambongensis]